MKVKEREILSVLNRSTQDKIKESQQSYSRFDGYNKNAFFEVKHRNKFYQNTIIEFDKFSYNLKISELYGKVFIYAVCMEKIIYVFDITKLNAEGFNFNFEWIKLPASTEFGDNSDRLKLVGYININKSIKKITL